MRNRRTTRHATFTSLTTLLLVPFIAVLGLLGQGTAHAGNVAGISNQASPSGFPIGSGIYDSAVLGGGAAPTGFLTFNVYGPSDPTCTAPLFTTTTVVTGNGYYESSRYTAQSAGTYRWTVAYGGDENNLAPRPTTCSDPAGQVAVSKTSPMLNASPSWILPNATDTATITGAGPTGPAGTITYNLYGPGNTTCAGDPVFTTTRNVAGNGSYVSGPFVPTVAGVYQWIVTYSGDSNNWAGATMCSDTNNGFTASVASTVVSGSPTTVAQGGTINVSWSGVATPTANDWIALYKVGTPSGGTVTAWKYTTGAASGSTTLKFPWSAPAGNYEVRLMSNNTTQRLATSGVISMVY
jgi:hypothetical protein